MGTFNRIGSVLPFKLDEPFVFNHHHSQRFIQIRPEITIQFWYNSMVPMTMNHIIFGDSAKNAVMLIFGLDDDFRFGYGDRNLSLDLP